MKIYLNCNARKTMDTAYETKANVSSVWGLLTVIFACGIMVSIIMLTGIGLRYQRETQFTRNAAQQLNLSVKRLEQAVNGKEFQDYYSSFLTKMLSAQQLDTLAQSFWTYGIFVNGKEKKIEYFKVEGTRGKIVIALSETEQERLLPLDMHTLGSVCKGDTADSFESHLSINSPVLYKTHKDITTGKDSATGRNFRKTTITYSFDAITSDQVIEVIPDPMFEMVPGMNNE